MNSTNKTARINVMKNTLQTGFFILCMIFKITNILAQTEEWKTAKLDDGKITVQYNISTRTDEKGDEVPLIEYIAKTTDSVSMRKCISLMKDVSKHKEFTGDNVSEKVQTISENEWVVYYYSNSPWPLPDNDCVQKMTISEDTTEKTALFTFIAAPTMFDKKNVKRITYQDTTYAFKDLGNGKVEVTTTMKITPPMKVPHWMIKANFPGEPAKVVRKFVKLAKEIK